MVKSAYEPSGPLGQDLSRFLYFLHGFCMKRLGVSLLSPG